MDTFRPFYGVSWPYSYFGFLMSTFGMLIVVNLALGLFVVTFGLFMGFFMAF
jgi:hypothetical protein